MSLIAISEMSLVLGLKNKIIFVHKLSDKWTTSVHILDPQLPILPKKPSRYLQDENEAPESEDVNQNEQIFQIQNISANSTLLAVSASDKTLYLFEIQDSGTSLTFKSRRKLARNTSALKFFPDSNNLLVSDKTGDVFVYGCFQNFDVPGMWILGHISQVLDIMIDSSMRYVLSCDRDEKIRITHYPDTSEIEAFCLGHKEFVSTIEFVTVNQKEYLVSGSGDSTIKVWDYTNGKKIHEFQMDSPIARIRINGSKVVVLFRRPDMIVSYDLKDSLDLQKNFEVTGLNIVSMDLHEDAVFILYIENGVPKLMHKTLNTEETLDCLAEYISFYEFEDSLENLYKKRVDNASIYLERKKRRIEDENSKSKV